MKRYKEDTNLADVASVWSYKTVLQFQVFNPLAFPYGENDVLQREMRYGGNEENYEDEQVDIQYYISKNIKAVIPGYFVLLILLFCQEV